MAQYDVILTQNTAAAGTEFNEKTVAGTSGTLFGFDSGANDPANINPTEGVTIDGSNLKFEHKTIV